MPQILSALGGDVHLLVAGEFYEPEDAYRDQVKRLRLGEKVTLVNQYIPNENVSSYFRAANLLVLPYRSATQSGVIQMAHFFGLPVVSTTVGGLPEVIQEGETGFLVEPENPEQLADAVVGYFQHKNEEAMKAGLTAAGKKYSWDGMLTAIEGLAGINKK